MWIGIFTVVVLLLLHIFRAKVGHARSIADTMGTRKLCWHDTVGVTARTVDLESEPIRG